MLCKHMIVQLFSCHAGWETCLEVCSMFALMCKQSMHKQQLWLRVPLQKAMEERDAERIKRMAVEAAERAAANAEKKKKAEERIAGRTGS